MKIYNLFGYYDIQFKRFAISLPKPWRKCYKIRFRKRP